MNHGLKLLRGDGKEVTFFGEILPEQAVGILIQAALPGTVGVSEIDASVQTLLHVLITKELVAVIYGEGTQQGPGESGEGSAYSVCQRFCLAVRHEGGNQETGPAVYKSRGRALALSAADGITLPMAVLRAGISGPGPLMDRFVSMKTSTGFVLMRRGLAAPTAKAFFRNIQVSVVDSSIYGGKADLKR